MCPLDTEGVKDRRGIVSQQLGGQVSVGCGRLTSTAVVHRDRAKAIIEAVTQVIPPCRRACLALEQHQHWRVAPTSDLDVQSNAPRSRDLTCIHSAIQAPRAP